MTSKPGLFLEQSRTNILNTALFGKMYWLRSSHHDESSCFPLSPVSTRFNLGPIPPHQEYAFNALAPSSTSPILRQLRIYFLSQTPQSPSLLPNLLYIFVSPTISHAATKLHIRARSHSPTMASQHSDCQNVLSRWCDDFLSPITNKQVAHSFRRMSIRCRTGLSER